MLAQTSRRNRATADAVATADRDASREARKDRRDASAPRRTFTLDRPDPSRMSDRDVFTVAAAGLSAVIADGFSATAWRGYGKERRAEEADDARSHLRTYVLLHGEDGRCPRWDAAPVDSNRDGDATYRARWNEACRLEARRYLRRKTEERNADDAAVAAAAEEVDPAVISAARRAADGLELHDAAQVVEEVRTRLEAQGRNLPAAAADTLAVALSGVSNRAYGEVRGLSKDSVKKNLQRGRKYLADRFPTEDRMRADLLGAADAAAERRADGPPAERGPAADVLQWIAQVERGILLRAAAEWHDDRTRLMSTRPEARVNRTHYRAAMAQVEGRPSTGRPADVLAYVEHVLSAQDLADDATAWGAAHPYRIPVRPGTDPIRHERATGKASAAALLHDARCRAARDLEDMRAAWDLADWTFWEGRTCPIDGNAPAAPLERTPLVSSTPWAITEEEGAAFTAAHGARLGRLAAARMMGTVRTLEPAPLPERETWGQRKRLSAAQGRAAAAC